MSIRPASLLSVLSVFLLPAAACSQQVVSEDSEALRREVLEVQTARFTAMIEADIAELENVLSDDLTYTHTGGQTETKEDFLSTLRSQTLKYDTIQPKDVQIRLYGDVAVVTGLSDMLVTGVDQVYSFTIRFIEVYRRTDGSWELVAWQSTRLREG